MDDREGPNARTVITDIGKDFGKGLWQGIVSSLKFALIGAVVGAVVLGGIGFYLFSWQGLLYGAAGGAAIGAILMWIVYVNAHS